MVLAMGSLPTIRRGNGKHVADIAGTRLNLFAYRPRGTPSLIALVFHGLNRDAQPYRNNARQLADRIGAIIISPEFDRARFTHQLYQLGGVAHDGAFVPSGNRTVDLIAPLVAWVREASGQPDLPHVLIGHSAGGQFLSRVVAFAPTDATRFVVANPSTWVLPSLEDAVPYGFGRTPDAEDALRAYLERPVTALLGLEDTGTHNLANEPEAVAQGTNRLERGRAAFAKAKAAAEGRGWSFGWRLVEVPGVGHNAALMFSSPQAVAIFR
jgi:hypothetical protein